MSQLNMSTRHLRAFLALAELRSFTRAANRCHLSQPAFSALVRSLEDSLGARLFDRDTRNVELTAEGRLLEEPARRLVADFEGLVTDIGDRVARRKGRVSVAALPSLAAGWLPGIFAEFRRANPGVDLALHDTLSDQCLDLVRAGRADFAIAATGPESPEWSTEVLCRDRFHLVCRRDHPLARKALLHVKDLAAYPFVHFSRASSVRQHLEAALHPQQMSTVLEVEHLTTVMGMVEEGVGITVVPALTLFEFERGSLMHRPLAVANLKRTIYIVRRADRSLSPAAQALYDLMIERKPAPRRT
ncbi:MAG TPA: LysR family transcriptional regulator [Usitatibacteraceae bacterium]|nr:LysR family transcriptional regulator [Usitatibacteraceae bacterium]